MVMAPRDILKPIPGKPVPGRPFPGPIGCIPPESIDRLQFGFKDKNNDGKLSLDEWVRSKKGEITMADVKQFERYDRNNDGSVDEKEFMAGRKLDRWLKDAFDGIKDGWRDKVVPLGDKVMATFGAKTEG